MEDLYTIKSIVEVPVVERGGDIVKMHRIRAATRSGQPFSVEVPEDEFNEEHVRRVVEARAELIESMIG